MKKLNISDYVERFAAEAARDRKGGRDRKSVMGLFNGYLANYGDIASDVERTPVVTAPISELRPHHFRQFVSWFVIHKVVDRDKGQYVPVLLEFARWLGASKAIGKRVTKEILETLDELQGEPQRCEKLAKLLYEFTHRDMPTYEEWRKDPKSYAKKAAVLKAIHHEKPKAILDGYFTVARVGPAALWLNPEDPDLDADDLRAAETPDGIGPVQVPPEAAKLARVGDGLSAAIGRMSGFWKLLEAGGVYPG